MPAGSQPRLMSLGVNVTTTNNADGTVTMNVIVNDANGVQLMDVGYTYNPATSVPQDAFNDLMATVKSAFFSTVQWSDIPATFSFTFKPTDLLR